jgi:hypothetical protein
VKNWTQAVKASKFRKWCSAELVVINYYKLVVAKNSPQLGLNDRAHFDAIFAEMEPLSARAWEFFQANAGEHAPLFHSEFNMHVCWACIEIAFPAEFPTPFFSRLLIPVYAAGHVPCGLVGKDAVVDLAYAQNLTASDLVIA